LGESKIMLLKCGFKRNRRAGFVKARYLSSWGAMMRIKERVYLVSGSSVIKCRLEGSNFRAVAAFM
jgi:hypothetical protein